MREKGQVTIFIILGLIILFAFLLLLMLSGNMQKQQQKAGQEKTTTNLFQREAFRLFVESCLRQELENGILLIGQQGRLWNDQPGGRWNFSEGVNGVTTPTGERVFYAITKGIYEPPEKYPCTGLEEEPPFCKYFFPTKIADAEFGKIQLRPSTIAGDLQRYLQQQTVTCVDQFLREQVSSAAEIETRDAEVRVNLQENIISVHVEYPLSFRVGSDSFFHLSSFDFFYPSKLRQFLDAAIAFPLERDQRYVDFIFDQNQLTNDQFIYQTEEGTMMQNTPAPLYRELSISLNLGELANGDDLLTFTLPEQTILNKPGGYTFQIARQNRPPALNYISQCPAEEYDYLVVKDVPTNLGKIDFTLEANDPDEEEPVYSVDRSPDLVDEDTVLEAHFLKTLWANVPANTYHLFVRATDNYAEDFQDIRVRVDGQIIPKITFHNLVSPEQQTGNVISLEDPFCIEKESQTELPAGQDEQPTFIFQTPSAQIELRDGLNPIYSGDQCDNLNYDIHGIKQRNNAFLSLYGNAPQVRFHTEGNVVYDPTDPLCRYTAVADVVVDVQECTPVNNPDFPNPYIDLQNEKLSRLYRVNIGGREITGRSSFEANRACCRDNGNLKPEGTQCYTGQGCFTSDVYVEDLTATCNGQRGNVCGNLGRDAPVRRQNNRHNVCGSDNYFGCSSAIPQVCQGKEEYSVIENEGWCKDTTNGCSDICDSEVVHDGSLGTLTPQDNPQQFECGCTIQRRDWLCDENFDGDFRGTCKLGFGAYCSE